MIRTRLVAFAFPFAFPFAFAFALAAPRLLSAQDITKLSWMQGCWSRRTATSVIEEQWMSPAGGTMLGMGRTTRGAETREWEFLRIATVDRKLAYIALPSGQNEATFPATTVSDTLVVFENPAHDFPKYIRYRRGKADSIVAAVGAGAREIVYSYGRVHCAS